MTADPALPRVLQSLVPAGLEGLQWKRIGPLRSSRLRFGDPAREVALQHIAAGGKVLEHGHRSKPHTRRKPTQGSEWWVHQVRSMNLKLPLEEEMEEEEKLFEDE